MYFLRENAKEIKKVSMTLKTGEGCRHTQLGLHLGLDALHSLYNGITLEWSNADILDRLQEARKQR